MSPMPKGSKIKNEDEDMLDDDDMESLMEGLDKAIATGNQKALSKAVDDLLDEDAKAPHEAVDDDEEESHISRKKKKIKAAAEEEKDGDEEEESEEEEGDEEEESEEESSEDSEEEGEEEGQKDGDKKTPSQGALVSRLRKLGYKVHDDMDDETAADLLVQHAQDRGQKKDGGGEGDQLINAARLLLANPEALAKLRDGGGEKKEPEEKRQVSTADTTSAALEKLKGLGDKWRGLSKKPEYDPAWENSGVLFHGGMYIAPANNPALAPIAEKMNAHRRWQLNQLESLQDIPEIIQSVTEAISTPSKPEGTLTEERLVQILRNEESVNQRNFVAQTIAEKNARWMFVTGSDGSLVADPSGRPIPTEYGKKYDVYMGLLVNQGFNINTADGLKKASDIAIALIGKEEASAGGKTGADSGAGVDDARGTGKKHSTNAKGDSGSDDEKASRLKDRRKKLAAGGGGGKAGISTGSAKKSDDKKSAFDFPSIKSEVKSLAREFEDALGEAGITDGNLRFGSDDDDE